jgi:tyrosyl-tRNA synthetase
MFGTAFKPKIDNDSKKIESLLTRGVERVYPSAEFLRQALLSGRQLSIYLGIDPTGQSLHLGHAITLMKLREFQDLGHKVIVMYGGFTATIGDPSGKLSARRQLSQSEIKKNAAGYKKSIGKILDLKKNNIEFRDNADWSNKMKPADIMSIASRFTVPQLLERDMFQERLKGGKEIYLHEFLYPIFQAYDSVALDVDIEIGGNDQTFNMLAGRTLMRKLKNKEKMVISMKLLEDSSGKKMGKTEGNMVCLDQSADEMFGRIMSWADTLILPGLELCTTLGDSEIAETKQALEAGSNPKDFKLKLAREVVTLYHGKKQADAAEANFANTFSVGGAPENLSEIEVMKGALLLDTVLKEGIVSSKSDWHRLVSGGAVSNLATNEKVSDPGYRILASATFRIGKKRFVRVLLK